jgi:hypothetical protein
MSSRLRTTRLWVIGALAALLACETAAALPPPSSAAGSVVQRTAALPLPALVPPANDAFAAAEPVPGLPFAASESTLEATTAPDDPSCSGNAASVWYAYTSPVTVWLTAGTAGSDFDTTLSAYTGTQGALVQVACNNDTGGPQSEITFLADAGVTYYLMAAGATGGGALELALDIRPPLKPIGVRTMPAYEDTPAAGPDHFAWAKWGPRTGGFWDARVQPEVGGSFALNRGSTNGFLGGFDGDTVVYQEARGKQSSIVFFDLPSRTRSNPPPGVNTRLWEWHPTLSGDWILFGRRDFRARIDRVILRNLTTGETRIVNQIRTGPNRGSEAGQVNGNHAVWYSCTPRCRVYRHDIAAMTTTVVPNPGAHHAYNPSVTPDGTVYFTRSGRGCGVAVRLVRASPDGATTVLTPIPRPWDSFHTYALANDDGTTSVFYDRRHCRTGASDIFKVIDP